MRHDAVFDLRVLRGRHDLVFYEIAFGAVGRLSMIFWDVAGPIPGSASSSSLVAELMSILLELWAAFFVVLVVVVVVV